MSDLKDLTDQLREELELGASTLNVRSMISNVHFLLRYMRIMVRHGDDFTPFEKEYLLRKIEEVGHE